FAANSQLPGYNFRSRLALASHEEIRMATAQAPSKPAPATPGKHEVFVDNQLRRALGRIRTLDILASLFVFVSVALFYGLSLIILDAWLVLPSLVRQAAFAVFILGTVGYLVWVAVRLIRFQLNPYYAAIKLENTLPGSKNSLINWLDLRERALPAAIRG